MSGSGTQPDPDYAEALRRVWLVEASGAGHLDLSGLSGLTRIPPEIEKLKKLTSLNLAWCAQISDIGVLSSLTKLTSLNLYGCAQISDIGVLRSLTALTSLNLAGTEGIVSGSSAASRSVSNEFRPSRRSSPTITTRPSSASILSSQSRLVAFSRSSMRKVAWTCTWEVQTAQAHCPATM